MGLRDIIFFLLIQALYWEAGASLEIRQRRQASSNFPNQPSEPRSYQPPIPLGSSSVPVASAATIQNSYQPPISLIRSNEYQSSLLSPQNHYAGNAARSYQSQPGPQSYVLPNQPQHQSHSVQYIPPANPQQSFASFQQAATNNFPQPATSYSVHQQPLHNSQGQSYAILSDNSGLPQSTAERTYSTHSKAVGSSHVPVQSIHKTPASEIQKEKGPAAKEKDASKDEYVVYYYYYYDNDTSANNNLSLNFDDIPTLEGYDNEKIGKEPEKSASARSLSNVNSLSPNQVKPEKSGSPSTETSSSQPRSVGDVYARPDRPNNSAQDETVVQPLKPVSNVFRYGSNEVPRFPVLPNFIVTEVPTTTKPQLLTADTLTSEPPTTQSALINAQADLKSNNDEDNDLNNVLDNRSDLKSSDDKFVEEEPPTTTTTTTTEPPTTTEEPTTTTERSRRRPSISGGRRRFNSSPSPSFQPSRNRQASGRSTSSTSSTTTTTTASPSRRSFQGNRIRPRQPIGSNRPRPGARTSENEADKADSKALEATTASTTTTTTSAAARSRFSTSAAPRRFQSNRARLQTSSSTTSTTRAPASAISSRSRTTSRPRPNLVTRNRPPRPGFLRPRPGSEPEEPETTTTPAPAEETSPDTIEELPSTDDESNETEEDNETSDEETEEPTTTEASRFSALFRPRNRNALGNRPRPVIGNRPSRT